MTTEDARTGRKDPTEVARTTGGGGDGEGRVTPRGVGTGVGAHGVSYSQGVGGVLLRR